MLLRLVERHDVREHGQVLEDLLVHAPLDRGALFRRQRLAVREVEAELVGADGRAGLLHVVAERLAERLVQEMRRRVVRHRREAVAPGHDGAHTVADGEALALEEQRLVVAGARGTDELGPRAGLLVLDVAGVRDLAAALGVERATRGAWRGSGRPRPAPAPRSP